MYFQTDYYHMTTRKNTHVGFCFLCQVTKGTFYRAHMDSWEVALREREKALT